MPQFNPPLFDVAALAWFLAAFVGYQWLAGWGPISRRSVAGAVQRQRVAWMRNMAMRENRMLDGVLLNGLSQGNAFFASTSAIAIGGLAALLGSGDKVQSFMEQLPYSQRSEPFVFEIKILLLIGVFIYAFFKFAWAFRLSHYVGIMIGATPQHQDTNDAECERSSLRTAKLIGLAADHANSGLRSFYYAFAAMAWFYHPIVFMVATAWVLVILIRRDFFSRSLRILADAP